MSSLPLIPLLNGILVMPLSGTVDVERARQAVETALNGAGEREADHPINDVTGITAVDETVASMLVQAAKGLSLLGTRAVITGIRAEVAKTLVGLDLHLRRPRDEGHVAIRGGVRNECARRVVPS